MSAVEFHREADGSLSVEAAIFQALGAVSVCWETPEGSGVFDSDRAKEIGEALLEVVRAEYEPVCLKALQAIAPCVVGWPPGEMPVWALKLDACVADLQRVLRIEDKR